MFTRSQDTNVVNWKRLQDETGLDTSHKGVTYFWVSHPCLTSPVHKGVLWSKHSTEDTSLHTDVDCRHLLWGIEGEMCASAGLPRKKIIHVLKHISKLLMIIKSQHFFLIFTSHQLFRNLILFFVNKRILALSHSRKRKDKVMILCSFFSFT